GGLHGFADWHGHVLTDSGGYQVFSLSPSVDDDGVAFRSTYDGTTCRLTPEGAVDEQIRLGADIQMVLDVCPPLPSPPAVLRSRWPPRFRGLARPRAHGLRRLPGVLPLTVGGRRRGRLPLDVRRHDVPSHAGGRRGRTDPPRRRHPDGPRCLPAASVAARGAPISVASTVSRTGTATCSRTPAATRCSPSHRRWTTTGSPSARRTTARRAVSRRRAPWTNRSASAPTSRWSSMSARRFRRRPRCSDLGGLHGFADWHGHVLTDSGGYQVFSLSPSVDDDGVAFRSTYDGTTCRLTPEGAVDEQIRLGADIQMVLDVCPPLPSPPAVL